MTGYSMLWLALKSVLRGHGNAPVFFDTEAREYRYHLAKIGRGYCQKVGCTKEEPWYITLHEEYENG